MNSGVESFINLVNKFDAERTVAFRMVLLSENSEWNLHTLVIENIPVEHDDLLPRFNYNYGDVAFIANTTSGRKVMDFLQGNRVDSYTFHSPLSQRINDNTVGTIGWTRYPSHANQTNFAAVPYPVTQYYINSLASPMQVPGGFLVGQNCPFFPSFQQALTSLIYVNDPQQTRHFQEAFYIRVIHDDARIEKVDISPTQLTVHLIDAVLKSGLQISSLADILYDGTVTQNSIAIALPDGIPSELWIVLKRGSEWLDYVHLGQQFPFYRTQQNVTILPSGIHTRIQELIAQGEGPRIEFKRLVSDEKDRFTKTVAAFANGDGGTILFGIDDEDGEILGLTESNDRTEQMVRNLIRDKVVPEPQIHMEFSEVDSKRLLAVDIEKGISPPYGVHPEKPIFYVRRGASTFPARQEEIRSLAKRDEYSIYKEGEYANSRNMFL